MWRILILTISVGLVFAQAALGQAGASSSASPGSTTGSQTAFVNLRGISQDYRLGAGDQVEIQVIEHPQLAQTLRVSAAGEIIFPLVGPIQVLDLTAAELEAKIASHLEEKNLLKRPEVLVYLREYQAKRIYVAGEVVSAGELIMSQELTAMDALSLARGVEFTAGRYAYVHRRVSQDGGNGPPSAEAIEKPEAAAPGTEIIKIDLQPLKQGRVLDPDVPLRNGDVLIVSKRQTDLFFVAGEVVRPRNYVIPPEQTLLVSQAISTAGGPTKTAKMSQGVLVRYNNEGQRQELPVDFAAILKGEQKDFEIYANDVIFIPGSKAKTVGQAFVTMADAMIMQQIFKVGRQMQLPEAPNYDHPGGNGTP